MSRRVLLMVNTEKVAAVTAERQFAMLVERAGGQVVGRCDARGTGLGALDDIDLAVVLGGDGTLLGAARAVAKIGCPLLGVNFGKVGFLASFDGHSIEHDAELLFSGREPLRTVELTTLEARVHSPDDDEDHVYRAVNELAITAGPPYRMISLGLSFDGQPGPQVRGDGLIVATPIGSTAYNVAAGGPIVAPGIDAMIVTPIAAHSLSFRPIVLSASREVSITLEQGNRHGEDGTTLVSDGQIHRPLAEGAVVKIRRAEEPVRLVMRSDVSYWSTLMDKMSWARQPTNGTFLDETPAD